MSYGGSGAGSGRISTASDAALNSLNNGDVLTYNSSTQKWTNTAPASATPATSTTAGAVKLTGDLTGTSASPALAAIGTAGNVGSASQVPVLSIDTKGRITSYSSVAVSAGGGGGSSSLGIVNVKDYGAVGDGVTDDAAAITAAMAAVHNRSSSNTSGQVYFPPATYAIRSALTVPINVYLVGETQGASRIVYTNSGSLINGPLITIGASGQINTAGGIKRLTIDAQGYATINTLLYGPQEGSSLTEAWLWGASNTCVSIKSNGIVGGSNKFVISDCWIWTNGDTGMFGIDMDANSGNLTIRSCTVVGVNRSNNNVNGNPVGSAAIRLTNSGIIVNDVNFEHWESGILSTQSTIWAVGITGFWIVYGVNIVSSSTALPVFLYDMGFDGGSITYTVNDPANGIQLGYARTYVNEAYVYAPFHFTRNIWNLGRVDVATKAGVASAQMGYDTPYTTNDQTRFKFTAMASGGNWKEAASIDTAGFFGTTDSAYNGQHLRIGAYHLWIDASGRLMVKNGTPSSDTDGTVVGAQS